MFDLNQKVTAQMLRAPEIASHGSKQYVIDTIMKMRTECGYDDFCFLGWFELGGFEPKEIEEQMQIFAEEVMPVIARECGGKVGLPRGGLAVLPGPEPARPPAAPRHHRRAGRRRLHRNLCQPELNAKLAIPLSVRVR